VTACADRDGRRGGIRAGGSNTKFVAGRVRVYLRRDEFPVEPRSPYTDARRNGSDDRSEVSRE
jgi:hypothetical protein